MPIEPRSRDRWGTKQVLLEGGTVNNEDLIWQGENRPGSLTRGINFETSLIGGYRRISGYRRYIDAAVPGTGQILGTFVHETGVVSMRSTKVFFAATSATAWTELTSTATAARTGAGKYRSVQYNWVTPTTTFVDGVNTPAKYTNGTYSDLNNAPTGQAFATEFKRHLWLAPNGSQTLTFSSPGNDNNYDATAGAGSINVGFGIHGMGVWRDELFVFGRHNISKIVGTSATDWILSPVTGNIGCVASDSIKEIGGDLVFLSSDGIRTIAGTMRIGDVDISNLSRPVQNKATALIPIENYTDGSTSSVVIRGKSQYRIFSSRSSSDRSTQGGLIGGLRQTSSGDIAWEWFEFLGASIYCCDSRYLTSETELVVHAHNDTADNYVYTQESGSDFTGFSSASTAATTIAMPWYLQSPHHAFEDARLRKTMYRLCAYIYAEGNVTIYTGSIYDFNDASVVQPVDRELGRITNAATYDDPAVTYDNGYIYDSTAFTDIRFCVQLEGSALVASFVLYGTGGAPFTVRSMSIEYALNGRR